MNLIRAARRFGELDRPERRVLLRALLVVSGARGALPLLSLRRVRALAGLLAGRPSPRRSAPPGRIRWAVEAASLRVPGARCLVRAVAAEAMLRAAGHPSTLLLGVDRRDGDLDAHAWVESGGQVVIGGDVHRYARVVVE